MSKLLLGMLTVLLFSSVTLAQSDQDWNLCAKLDFTAISACTRQIDRGTLDRKHLAITYSNRAAAYCRLGDDSRCIADATKAVGLDPDYAKAYNNRAPAYFRRGDYDSVIADTTKALELDPQFIAPYINRAAAFTRKGDYERAIADATKAIELDPNLAAPYANRAAAYKGSRAYDRAVSDYNTAIELEPNETAFVKSRGLTLYEKGDFNGAANDLLRAVQPAHDRYAMLFLYLARMRAGEAASAELEANIARLQTNDWPYPVAELFLGRRSPAALLAAASDQQKRCEAQFYIGQWHILENNPPAAFAAFTAAVSTCPKTFIEYAVASAELRRPKP